MYSKRRRYNITELQEKILELRKEGLNYSQISKKVSCSKSYVRYVILPDSLEKHRIAQAKRRKKYPYKIKLDTFFMERDSVDKNYKYNKKPITILQIKRIQFCMPAPKCKAKQKYIRTFTVEELLEKIGPKPMCYLTGDEIDLFDPPSYAFDHIIPRSKGGPNTLENLGLSKRNVNFSKHDMLLDDFIQMCVKVCKHNGYTVIKEDSSPNDELSVDGNIEIPS